jgi:glyceraldehyde 3-phosphate dehydrogenase
MAVKVGINGFGRIGRLVLRAALERKDSAVEVVAINDLGPAEANAHLLKHDTVHGRYPGEIKVTNSGISVDGRNIEVTAERDPTKLPWGKLGIDVVAECTGIFTKRSDAEKHIAAGAKRVLISAPATDEDITVCFGVNEDKLAAAHKVISNASCTTNCLAPVAYVIDQAIGIERGYMTTVHSYTGDQSIVDTLHKDLRRARAAALNMIPTSTGAAKAVGLVLPHLNGKLDGTSIRVPTANVSMIDFKFIPKKKTTAEEINDAARKAAGTARLRGILVVNDEPLVSSDFNHNPASATFDATQTHVIEGALCRVLAWYDNEWGFSNRMVDTLGAVGKLG